MPDWTSPSTACTATRSSSSRRRSSWATPSSPAVGRVSPGCRPRRHPGRSPRNEEGRGVYPARGVRADPDGSARDGVPVPDDLRGQGVGTPARHHGALPRRRADQLAAAEGQARVRGRFARRQDGRGRDPPPRPHGRDRRRQGVRHAGRRGLPDPNGRERRRDASGPPGGGRRSWGLTPDDMSPHPAELRALHLAMLDAVLVGDGLGAVATLAAAECAAPVALVIPRLELAAGSPSAVPELGRLRRYALDRCRGRVAPVPTGVAAEVPIASGEELLGVVLLLGDGVPDDPALERLRLVAVAALTELALAR